MGLFMFTLFMLSFAMAFMASNTKEVGFLLGLFHFALGSLSLLAGVFFAMLYYGPFGNPGSLGQLFEPVIALTPCILGSACAHWLDKPVKAQPAQQING
jgi:hypothetical protein